MSKTSSSVRPARKTVAAAPEEFDVLIRNGTVIDGTGKKRFAADVAIVGDRIAEIGRLAEAKAKLVIDAAGQVVVPGFIDVHNHSDGWLVREKNFAPKTTQGFTTEVLMADGIGYAPVDQMTAPQWIFYLRALDGLRLQDYRGWESYEEFMVGLQGRTAQNVCSHIPYANLRSLAKGWGSGAVDDFQMREIQRQIRMGMEAGAVGVSTGLDYIVQCFSTTDELVEALSVMAPLDGLYVTHVRYKKGLMAGVKEAVEIAKRAGVRLHVSHLKTHSPSLLDELLTYIDKARREVDLSYDVYPYQPGSTLLNYLLPYEVWEDGPLAALGKLGDPAIRAKFAAGLEAYRLPLDKLRIAWVFSKENSHHQGKWVSDYIEETGKSPADALFDLLIEERLSVLMVVNEGEDKLIEPFIQHDLFMLGSDGIFCEGGVVHPRMFGSVGRFLGPMVRDQKLLTLEDAIFKLSGHAAKRFGLKDRGVLKRGAFADIVVLDPATITDRATYDEPQQTTVGISTVLVNGVPIVEDGEPVEDDQPPGRYIRAE